METKTDTFAIKMLVSICNNLINDQEQLLSQYMERTQSFKSQFDGIKQLLFTDNNSDIMNINNISNGNDNASIPNDNNNNSNNNDNNMNVNQANSIQPPISFDKIPQFTNTDNRIHFNESLQTCINGYIIPPPIPPLNMNTNNNTCNRDDTSKESDGETYYDMENNEDSSTKNNDNNEVIVYSDSLSKVQKKAWKLKDTKPGEFLYRFNENAIKPNLGKWSNEENKIFMSNAKQFGVNAQWGIFSRNLKRVGYTCSNKWRSLIKNNKVKDWNYHKVWDSKKGKKVYKQLMGKYITEEFRRYAFEIIQVRVILFEYTDNIILNLHVLIDIG